MIKFQRCDLVGWITDNKIEIGIFWDDTPNFYSGKSLVLYPSNKQSPTSVNDLFPICDVAEINSYLEELKGINKISQEYRISERIDDSGRTILSLTNWTIPGSYKVVKKPDWDCELISCPSQCYCKFLDKTENKIYCIYLRWRWNDPWTSELIPCEEDGEISYSKHEPWIEIKTKRGYSEPEHEKLQKETIEWVKKNYSDILWLQS